MFKIAIAGKGGAGKTMITSCLAYIFASQGESVYAIDADPNPTLGQALGFPAPILKTIQPILSLKNLIYERTGSPSTALGSYFRLNPFVDDIPETYSATYRSIKLLIMGSTKGANTGCACAENTMTRALISHLVLRSKETILMDMEAGTEHLGRGTASAVDFMLVIVEPSKRSIIAAKSIISMSKELPGLRVLLVGNKVRNDAEIKLIEETFPEESVVTFIPWHEDVITSENNSIPVYDAVPEITRQIKDIVNYIS